MIGDKMFSGCGFTWSNSKGECFRSYNPKDPRIVYINDYITKMVDASVKSNFKVKKSTKKIRSRQLIFSSLHDSSSSLEIISMPVGIHDNYSPIQTQIRDYCQMFMTNVADIACKQVDDLWFDRMHEPRLIHNKNFGFSESLANWLYNKHFDRPIKLVFSQSGFCINVVQLMLTFKALINASDSKSHDGPKRELIVYALESDPKVRGI